MFSVAEERTVERLAIKTSDDTKKKLYLFSFYVLINASGFIEIKLSKNNMNTRRVYNVDSTNSLKTNETDKVLA